MGIRSTSSTRWLMAFQYSRTILNWSPWSDRHFGSSGNAGTAWIQHMVNGLGFSYVETGDGRE
jgi:hypothetical protein